MHVFSSYAFHFVPGIDDADEELENDITTTTPHLPDWGSMGNALIYFIVFLIITIFLFKFIKRMEKIKNKFSSVVQGVSAIILLVTIILTIFNGLRFFWYFLF